MNAEKRLKNYECPSVYVIKMEKLMETTLSGQHTPGTNNGTVGDAKRNNVFFIDDEENDK